MENKKEQSKQLALMNNSVVNRVYEGLSALLPEAQKLVQAGMVKATEMKAEDLALVMEVAIHCKIPYAMAITNIHVIKGKVAAGYKFLEGLAIGAGCKIEILENFVEVIRFRDKFGYNYDLSRNDIYSGKYHIFELDKAGNIINDKVPDGKIGILKQLNPLIFDAGVANRRTTMKVTRTINIGGINTVTVAEDSYYLHEAYQSGFFGEPGDTSKMKVNWLLYTKSMMMSKLVPRVLSSVAADAMMGMAELGDAYAQAGINYTVEDGVYTIVDETKDETANQSSDINIDEVDEAEVSPE